MNLFWVFVPGIIILTVGLLIFEWRNRKHQLTGAAPIAEKTGNDNSQ